VIKHNNALLKNEKLKLEVMLLKRQMGLFENVPNIKILDENDITNIMSQFENVRVNSFSRFLFICLFI
jgi:hypothetical protein